MPHVQAEGARLYYEEAGSGRPVVFVHEFGSDLREWERSCASFRGPIAASPTTPAATRRAMRPTIFPSTACNSRLRTLRRSCAASPIPRAHVVGLSMGGYAALQFGLRYPEMATAIVAAGAGTGSAPSVREAWLKEAPGIARGFVERGMAAMAQEMGNGPTRIQLKRKDPRGWAQTVENLRGHSAQGMSNTMARYQALRPSLHDFRDLFATMRVPTLLAVGDEDIPCLETNLMLEGSHSLGGPLGLPEHRPRHQPRGARRLQYAGAGLLLRRRARKLARPWLEVEHGWA